MKKYTASLVTIAILAPLGIATWPLAFSQVRANDAESLVVPKSDEHAFTWEKKAAANITITLPDDWEKQTRSRTLMWADPEQPPNAPKHEYTDPNGKKWRALWVPVK
jgi:hypothetical protein